MLTLKRANNLGLNNSTEFLIKLKRMCDSLPPAGGASIPYGESVSCYVGIGNDDGPLNEPFLER